MLVAMIWPDALACAIRGTNTQGNEKCHGFTPIQAGQGDAAATDPYDKLGSLGKTCPKDPNDPSSPKVQCAPGMYAT